ncbi:hypothetical protein C4K39_5296 [Pseudomonas sessilinigenes]|nr:hypothetical protein C4K39_5296 [Pseudomonas sessilinigenes]
MWPLLQASQGASRLQGGAMGLPGRALKALGALSQLRQLSSGYRCVCG